MSGPFGRRGRRELGDARVLSLAEHGSNATDPTPDNVVTSELRRKAKETLAACFEPDEVLSISRATVAARIEDMLTDLLAAENVTLNRLEWRNFVTDLVNYVLDANTGSGPKVVARQASATSGGQRREGASANGAAPPRKSEPAVAGGPAGGDRSGSKSRASVESAKERIQGILMERIDVAAASELPRAELAQQITQEVRQILAEQKIQLNLGEQRDLVTMLLNDMLGLGPLEPLLSDESITDIMVNGPKQVYVERGGRLELTDVVFRDNAHVMNIASRIVTRVGRRVDESSPLVDARLSDGSRVNIIAPPLAIDGTSISIRKFAKQKITLEVYERQRNMSPQMAALLRIAARSRCNILICGGTGSGKTTLLNALSQMIDQGERIVTIEDAAELQLQQPHVVRLETRPPNLEGQREITMRDLVKNALRMRPDRIILGEVRGGEALDMLQAMNTGHEGSMGTIHANNPREGLTRLENMIGMTGINLAPKAVRTQVADALDVIVQVARMRDGVRRVVSITEVIGMEGDIITTQELFRFKYEGEDASGSLIGSFESSNLRPHFYPKAEYFGLAKSLMEAI